MAHVLLAAGDELTRDTLVRELAREGYTVLPCGTGERALRLARDGRPRAAIVDHALADMRGLDVCKALKRSDATDGIAVLLLGDASEVDRIVAFELGVDDYVEKPACARELVLRVDRALARRPAAPAPEMTIGPLRVEPELGRVWVYERAVQLTPTELRLLIALCTAQPRVLTRAEIRLLVYGADARCDKRTVDAHVRHLRDKLGELGPAVQTVKRVGYRFMANE